MKNPFFVSIQFPRDKIPIIHYFLGSKKLTIALAYAAEDAVYK